MQNFPTDWQYRVNGSYYKIGRFGFVFIWLHGWWKRSTKTAADLERARSSAGD